MTRRLEIFVEDIRFADILLPAAYQIAVASGVTLEINRPTILRGCRAPLLKEHVRRTQETDIVLIAADAMNSEHRLRASFRRKRAALEELVGLGPPSRSYAVAEPSVEAWLLSDLPALTAGLETSLQRQLTVPPTMAAPRTEREAKELLGKTIQRIVGETLARSGFEFADAIVERMDLANAHADSLRDWARDFERLIRQAPSLHN